jgi:hypothetical protein
MSGLQPRIMRYFLLLTVLIVGAVTGCTPLKLDS